MERIKLVLPCSYQNSYAYSGTFIAQICLAVADDHNT